MGIRFGLFVAFVTSLLFGCASLEGGRKASNLATPHEVIPPNKDNDLRLFYADGKVLKGSAALAKMNTDANLTLWLAGNQFFAMADVIGAFQKDYPAVGNVALMTLPPGFLRKGINKGGWNYEGKDYPMQPDIYASVDLGDLKALKVAGKMDQYMIYLHNALDLIVAKGNPKNVKGIDDLGRDDLNVMLGNPLDEGIMIFYAKRVLQKHNLWEKLTGGKECKSCWTKPNVYFTAVHHRETPPALKSGATDVGIVWATETKNALEEGYEFETVPLPPEDSLINEVAYAIGPLTTSKRHDAIQKYFTFLISDKAQNIYAKFGFIKATKEELNFKPIP